MRKSARTQIPPFFDNDPYILEDFENASPYFFTFLANCAIEKLLAGFNVQPRIGMIIRYFDCTITRRC